MKKEVYLKQTYYLPYDYPMYDMCHCSANCKKDCARKKSSEEIFYTVSNLSSVCKDYEEKI